MNILWEILETYNSQVDSKHTELRRREMAVRSADLRSLESYKLTTNNFFNLSYYASRMT